MKHTIFFIIFFCIGSSALAQDYLDEKYIDIDVLGWRVKVNMKLVSGDTSVLKKSLGLFGKELSDISKVLPSKAVEKLRNVVFWFEKETTVHGYTGEYFGMQSQRWLLKHDQNPAKAGGIEIVAGRYIDSKTLYNDWVILHELAHAYHDKIVGFTNEEIIRVFKIIQRAGLYQNVRFGFDKLHDGYAGTNSHEYFAELSTKYFGHSWYYPSDRADLKHYDILGYKLVEELWLANQK